MPFISADKIKSVPSGGFLPAELIEGTKPPAIRPQAAPTWALEGVISGDMPGINPIPDAVSRPFKAQGLEIGSAFLKGGAALTKGVTDIGEYVGKPLGIPRSQVFDAAAKLWADKGEELQRMAQEQGTTVVDQVVGEAVGGAIPGIAEFMLNVPYAALKGAYEASRRGDSSAMQLWDAILEGGKRFVLGKTLHAAGTLTRPLAVPAMGGIMATQTAAEGGTPEEIAKSAGVGLLYGAVSPGGNVGPKELRELYRRAPKKAEPVPVPERPFQDTVPERIPERLPTPEVKGVEAKGGKFIPAEEIKAIADGSRGVKTSETPTPEKGLFPGEKRAFKLTNEEAPEPSGVFRPAPAEQPLLTGTEKQFKDVGMADRPIKGEADFAEQVDSLRSILPEFEKGRRLWSEDGREVIGNTPNLYPGWFKDIFRNDSAKLVMDTIDKWKEVGDAGLGKREARIMAQVKDLAQDAVERGEDIAEAHWRDMFSDINVAAEAGFAPAPGFRRAPEAEAEAATGEAPPVRRSDIVKFLSEKLDVPIRTGKITGGKETLGIFKLQPEVIRARFANDIETIAHEVGHGLQKFLYPDAKNRKGLKGTPFENYSDELLKIATKPRSGQDPLPEGFAEFIRRYVVDEQKARADAPRFYSFFEAELESRAPEAREVLLQARADYDRWLKQPAAARILGQISTGEVTRRPVTFDSLYTATLDALYPIKKIVDAMKGEGELPASKDPYKLARLMAGWQGKADAFLEHQPFNFKTYQSSGKPLKAILDPHKGRLDDLRAYLVARRAIEKHAQGIETGILIEDAKKVWEAGNKEFGQTFNELQVYQDATLAYAVDAGVIGKEQALRMKAANLDYVPFYRVMDYETSGGTGKGFEVQRSPVKRMKGSSRDIIDPLESIIRNTYLFINAAEKNAVGTALVDLANAREGMGKYVERIPADRVPVKIFEPELMEILRKYGKWTETSRFTTTGQTIRETVKTGAGDTAKDGAAKLEGVAIEALTSRGWSKAEAEQILRRVKGAKTDDIRDKIIERVIEKTVVKETVREFGVELPEGFTTLFRPANYAPKGNVLTVLIDGKPRYFEVHPDIYRSLMALDKESVGTLVRILSLPSRLLRAGATLAPEFIARNPVRDQFSAFVYSKYGFVPGVDLVRGIFHLVKKDGVYWDWKKSGGEHSMLVSMDREYLQKNLSALMRDKSVTDVIRHPIDSLRMLSELGEAGTRIGEFSKGIKAESGAKAGLLQAGFASREVTLDFARMGAKTKAVNAIVAFWNANVQGMDKMIREFKDNPMPTTVKAAAAITLPSILLYLANRDDPRWKEIPQWQKDLFWIVMTDKHIYRIPKPFELGIIFGTVPERIAEAILESDPKAFDGILDAIVRGATPGYIPTFMIPAIENWANKSTFTDRPIVSRVREDLLPAYQYQPYTTEAAKKIGAMLGKLPVVGDTWIASPAKVENLVRGWTGGLGMLTLGAADKALRGAGVLPDRVEPTRTLSDIPFIKGFAVRFPSSGAESIRRFYDEYNRSQQVTKTARTLVKREGKLAEAEGLLGGTSIVKVEKIKTALGNAQRAVELVYANPKITPEEKRRLIDAIYLQMIEIAKAGNKLMEQRPRGRGLLER